MRRPRAPLALLAVLLAVLLATGLPAHAQSCTNLCLAQLPPNSCSGTATTTVSGTVYAPNGTDPLPNVLVFIPNAPLPAFTAGVACVTPSTPPGGSPLVGTISAADGSFTISNVPVGVSFPLVIQAGRWRRKITVPAITSGCGNTSVGAVSFPSTQTAGDTDDNIPLIAVATGNIDPAECVLRKVGIADTQFSDPGGSGRVQFYWGAHSAGAVIDVSTPEETQLEGTVAGTADLNNFDMVMFPCQGGVPVSTTASVANASYSNLENYVNAGGRVFATHWSQGWLNDNEPANGGAITATSPFQSVAAWTMGTNIGSNETATINTTGFSDAGTLSQWLVDTGQSTTPGEITLNSTFENMTAVNAPAVEWMSLAGPVVMQLSFDTPLNQPAANQCGRVLYNDYHVEAAVPGENGNMVNFPLECNTAPMSAQEKVLEYSLFDLSAEENSATLTPATQDFGSEILTSASAAQTFTWTNQAVFPASVTQLNASGDFSVASSNCTNVASGGSCQIMVVFTPTAVGARTGTLTVGSPGSTLTSTLTGTGVAPFSLSTAALNFPGTVIGATSSLSFNLMNSASAGFALPSFTISGDYSVTTTCASTVPASSSCQITVVFAPTAQGLRTGTLTVNAPGDPLVVSLTGTGLPSFTTSAGAMTFLNVDVGGSASQTLVLTSVAPIALPLPAITATGDYSATTNCPSSVPAYSSCFITVTFSPTTTGTRTGTVTVSYSGGTLLTTLTGNGVDFSIAVDPGSGSVIAGYGVTTVVTTTSIAGFDAPIILSCSTTAPGSACIVSLPVFTLDGEANTPAGISTTSQYTVIGYTGGFGGGWLWLFAVGSGLFIWKKRRSAGMARMGVLMLLLAAGLTLSGCSGKLPAENNPYTAPGAYTYTLTATDGIITHSATYTLNVSVK